MKTIIFIVLMFILESSLYAQEGVVLNIPSSAPIIINGYDYRCTYSGSLPTRIDPFMKLDIFRWYGLNKEYDTELKQKVFLETEEGKRLLKELKGERQKVMASTAYFIRSVNVAFSESKYDLTTKTFNIKFQPEFPKVPGYMHFPEVVVKCNLPVKQESYVTDAPHNTITPPYHYYNIIKLPMSEQTALSIENNISHLEFVLEFKIEQYKSPVWYINYFQGTAINMYIVDADSHEIYYAVDRSRLKILKTQQEKIRQEKLKQEELARQEKLRQEELARQENIRREKEIENLLPLINKQTINEQMGIYRKNRILEEAKKINAEFPNPSKTEIKREIDITIHLDSSKMDIVRIGEQRLNDELYALSMEMDKPYCTLNGVNYYKLGNHIFYEEKVPMYATIEKGLLGIKKKNAEFKYYGTCPPEIKEWCKKYIMDNGFQAIQYTHYDDHYIIELVTVSKETAKIIQSKNPKIIKTI